MSIFLRSGVLCTLLALAACGSPVEEDALPALVAQELKAVADICAEAQGRPLTTNAVKRADLNGDGDMDYVLDVDSMQCEGAAGIYGDRAKEVDVFVGDGEGAATLAFSDFAYAVMIEGAAPTTSVWLTVTADQCGKPPALDSASEIFCDRPLVWNAAARKFDFAPVSAVRMIE